MTPAVPQVYDQMKTIRLIILRNAVFLYCSIYHNNELTVSQFNLLFVAAVLQDQKEHIRALNTHRSFITQAACRFRRNRVIGSALPCMIQRKRDT